MYEIDPSRTDLVEEFRNNLYGPFSPELTLVVNRLRLMPMGDRHVLVCTRNGSEWTLAKMPSNAGLQWSSSKTDYLPITMRVLGKFLKCAGKQ